MGEQPSRVEYRLGTLDIGDVDRDPIRQFSEWLEDATRAGDEEPAAMTLATADADGRPSARTVLCRGFDERGFVFYSNSGSRKGRDLAANPRASLVFHWRVLERQVIVLGDTEQVADEEADAYFASRPRGSQIAAWVSPQSEVVDSREELERSFAETEDAYRDHAVPRPPHWSGFRVVPREIELWQGRPARFHDRIRYRRGDDGGWLRERLAP